MTLNRCTISGVNLSVSVIIPTYNRAHLVGRAIQSALQQVQAGDEIIVVDDGSTDATEEAVKPFRDRVVYIRKENGGAGAARNRGIREATGSLVAFLDSDDEWIPGKLELQRRLFAARPDILFSFSEFAQERRSGEITRRALQYWHEDPRSWDEILSPGVPYSSIAPLPEKICDFPVHFGSMYLEMFCASYMFTGTVVSRRAEAGGALHFEEGVPTYEDWFCYARLAKAGTGAFLNTETAWQRAHTGPQLTDADELTMAGTRILVMQRIWGSDPDFLRRHGDLYRRLLGQQYLRKATALIALGRSREAREVLHAAGNAPVTYRLLAALPGPAARALLRTRRTAQRMLFHGS